jgi:CRP-like cAMP-binding protein
MLRQEAGQDMKHLVADSPYVTGDSKGFEREISLLLAVSHGRVYKKGEMVYLQGEVSTRFFFLRRGKVKESILKEDGAEKILSIQESNTFFGESAAFDRQPCFATAVALEDSEIDVIPVENAEAVIREHPEVAFLIIRKIVRKLRLLGFQVKDFAFLDAQKRIAHILTKLSFEVGEESKDGTTIRRGITHEDLANLTGLSRVRVTTILNKLERAKVLTKKRLALTITDPVGLRRLFEPAPADEQAG